MENIENTICSLCTIHQQFTQHRFLQEQNKPQTTNMIILFFEKSVLSKLLVSSTNIAESIFLKTLQCDPLNSVKLSPKWTPVTVVKMSGKIIFLGLELRSKILGYYVDFTKLLRKRRCGASKKAAREYVLSHEIFFINSFLILK